MPRKPQNMARIVGIACLISVLGCGQPTPDNNGSDTSTQSDTSQPDVGTDTNMPRPSVRLRSATFNVGRLFDTVCDSNNCGDAADYERQLSDAEFAFKISQIANGLDELDADIITLQEVENQACLDALVAARPEYDFAVLGEIGGTATVDTAIIARGLTHVETRIHRASTDLMLSDGRTQRFARELLEAHFDLDGERVVAFSAHFKAQRNDDPIWRLGEASTAREIAEATQDEFPDAFVYLSGDLNDEPGTPPLDAMTSGGGMVSVTQGLSEDDIWTYAFTSTRIAIDHILFVPRDNGAVVPGSPGVVRDASGTLGGSDHAGLRAEFEIFTD